MHRPTKELSAAIGALVVAVSAAGLAWYRLGPVTRATVWAEDGGPFFRDRSAFGPVWSLLRPYEGYLHLLPRLVVDIGFVAPIEQYAVTVAAVCCAIVGVVSATVFVLARPVVPSWPLRLVLAAVPVTVPVVPVEINGNAANLHWFMLVVAPWLFAARVRRWSASLVLGVLALVAVLTEPQTLLFAPLLVVAWWRRSRPTALPVTVAVVLGGTAQVVTAVTTPRIARPGDPSIADVLHGYVLQPLAASWTRQVGAVADAADRHGAVVLVVPVVALVLVVFAALAVGSWRARVQVLATGVGSVVVWGAALVANAGADGRWGELPLSAFTTAPPTRYAAASAMLLTSAVVLAGAVLADRRTWSGPERSRALGVGAGLVGWAALAVVVAAAVANTTPGATQRSGGPEWAPQVLRQADVCRADPDATVRVATAPWGTDVPCALVLRSVR